MGSQVSQEEGSIVNIWTSLLGKWGIKYEATSAKAFSVNETAKNLMITWRVVLETLKAEKRSRTCNGELCGHGGSERDEGAEGRGGWLHGNTHGWSWQ